MALIKAARGKSPQWGERCYFAENATLAGNITMGNDCSIWFGAVIRADVDAIVMGNERTGFGVYSPNRRKTCSY